MEIIHRGTPQSEQIFRGTCQACKSVMQAKRSELTIEDYQREPGPFAHAKCPVCGHDFILYPAKKG